MTTIAVNENISTDDMRFIDPPMVLNIFRDMLKR